MIEFGLHIKAGIVTAILCTIMILNQGDTSQDVLRLRNHCICPGYPLLAECTVVGSITGTTVWRGSAFDCSEAGNEISLLHGRFMSGEAVCNNGLIVGRGIAIVNNSCYTSQLVVMVSLDLVGRTIECVHDNIGTEIIIDSLTINTTGSLSSSRPFISLVNVASRRLKFGWSPIALECPDVHYNILASNCGRCPTTTSHTTVNCTDVPTDGSTCTFAVQTLVCGNTLGSMSESVSVMLNNDNVNIAINSRQADCTVATVSAGSLAGILGISAVIFIIVLTLVKIIGGSSRTKTESDTNHQIANYEDVSHQVPSTVTIDTRKNVAYGQVHIANPPPG